MTGTNWAGNLTYGASALLEPASVDELCEVVAAEPVVRGLGSRHSFNRIADTTGVQVSVAGLPALVEVDESAREVTVSAGLRYGELVEELDRAGWALHNLASLPHISVAGAIATGTHGSGDHNGSLASSVAGARARDRRRLGADGAARRPRLRRHGRVARLPRHRHQGHARHRADVPGAPGRVRGRVVGVDRRRTSTRSPRAPTASACSPTGATPARARRGSSRGPTPLRPADFFGAPPATRELHPLPDESAEFTTTQLGAPGAWWDRLPHFRLGFTPSNGEELQTEYLVPRFHALAAIDAVRALAPAIRPHLFVSELRTIAADDLWLSPSHDVDCLAIHFTWRMHVPEVTALLPALDDALAPYAARPHWGKVFTSDRDRLDAAYPRIADFRSLADRLDPTGTFHNEQTIGVARPRVT